MILRKENGKNLHFWTRFGGRKIYLLIYNNIWNIISSGFDDLLMEVNSCEKYRSSDLNRTLLLFVIYNLQENFVYEGNDPYGALLKMNRPYVSDLGIVGVRQCVQSAGCGERFGVSHLMRSSPSFIHSRP